MTESLAISEDKTDKKSKFGLNSVFYLLMAFHVFLNVIGSPILKQVYLAEVALVFGCCLVLPVRKIFIPLIFFFFVEGQGRILMEYAPFTRFIYDLFVSIVILRLLVINKRIAPIKPFPNIILWGILLHTLWYLASIFNPHLPTPLLAIVASKNHIFPILFFISFVNSKELRSLELIDEIAMFILFCCLTQAGLAIFQYYMTEKHLYLISNYYKTVLGETKGMRFTGINFRPMGTGFAAAVYTSYLFLSVCLYYMKNRQGFLFSILSVFTTLVCIVAIFLSQVRSALLKYVLMTIASLFFLLLVNRRKERMIVYSGLAIVVIVFMLLPVLSSGLFSNQTFIQEYNLMTPMERLYSLLEFKDAYSARISLNQFIEIAFEKLMETPFGIGAGRASPAATLFTESIKGMQFYGENYSWYYENFYMGLIIELGYGAIFFVSIMVFTPVFFLYNAFNALLKKRLAKAKILFMSAAGMFVIMVGNWASAGLVSLPENFIFWLYAIIGMSTYQTLEEKDETTIINSADIGSR